MRNFNVNWVFDDIKTLLIVELESESHSSCVRLFVTPWPIQSMGFPKQEYWSGLLFPTPAPFCLLLLSHFSHVQLCATPQTSAHQAPPSLGFSRQ